MIVVVLLALAAPFWSGANMLAELNHTLHAKFALLEPPPELQRVRGIDFECKYFGHMYSFETMYVDFFKMNPWYRASSEFADFVAGRAAPRSAVACTDRRRVDCPHPLHTSARLATEVRTTRSLERTQVFAHSSVFEQKR